VALLAACAGPAPSPRVPGRLDRDTDAKAAADPILMVGVVVDTTWASGTLTVKDVQDYETWTITTSPETRFYGVNGGKCDLTAIEIGDRIQIQGISRVPLIAEADEIAIQKGPARPVGSQEALPR